jgi:hypothetical protein
MAEQLLPLDPLLIVQDLGDLTLDHIQFRFDLGLDANSDLQQDLLPLGDNLLDLPQLLVAQCHARS